MQRLSTATFIPAVCALAFCGLMTTACAKKQADTSTVAPPPAPAAAPAPAPATPAAGAPAAPGTDAAAAGTPPMTSAAPINGNGAEVDGVAASATTGTPVLKAGAEEAASRREAAQWALKQDDIKHEASGQWAKAATSSSSYQDHQGDQPYSAMQAAGEPNVETYSDDGHAWAPSRQDGGIEWLDLTYANAVHATEVRIRESMGSGAVVKVEAIDEAGVSHPLWRGEDPTKDLNYLILKFAPTPYKVNRLKVTLATNAVPGWNEIDAVQLVGKP